MFLLVIAIILLCALLYKYGTANNDYWKDQGVPYEPPQFFFGILKDNILMKKNLGEIIRDIYNKHDKAPYVGVFKFRYPELLIRDPEIIKDILIKDFSHFQKNEVAVSDKDVVLRKHPFVLHGEEWKKSRTELIQCFTSAKMKSLVPIMEIISDRFVNYIDELSKAQGALETKDLCTRFTVENVINSSFGLEANCFQPGISTFMDLSYSIFYPTFWMTFRTMCVSLLPSLSVFFDIRFIPKTVEDYFMDMITKLVKYRRENKIRRKDFLDILMDMEDKFSEEGYGMEEIISHSMGLFLDGTETSANAMAFVLYQLADNLHVQNRLRDEIEAVKKKHGGKVTYEAVQEMTYLDCVLSESLRMHPPGLVMTKVCTEDYTLPLPTDPDKTLTIKAGTSVSLPVYGLHYDEKYFPDPERFDPERFSEENKPSIQKCTYMPFGEGQRICAGQRFAQLQSKMGIVAVVSNYEIRVNEKTIRPLQLNPNFIILQARGGLWLDFHRRK